MSMISIQNLTFCYEGSYENVFEDVSIQLDTSWHLGLIGRNGRGKTTLLNLLQNKYPYSGTISSTVAFEYFPYTVEDSELDTLSVIEGILPGVEQWKLKREFNKLELDEDVFYRPFCYLSYGEQTKVLLAVLFLKENAFLLIDEPTNHLDLDGRQVVSAYLRSKSGFILVSHDRSFLDGCIDHVMSINKADVSVIQGNFSTWQDAKDKQDLFEKAQSAKLSKEIGKLSDSIKRTSNWADKSESQKIGFDPLHDKFERGIGTRSYIGGKTKKMQKQRKNYEKRQTRAIDSKSELLKNVENVYDLKLHPLEYRQNTLLTLKDFTVSYDGIDVCEPLSMQINSGDRIALRGTNGCGKSSIIKAILGQELKTQGELIKPNDLKISYVCQDSSNLEGTLTEYCQANQIDETLFKAILNKFDFSKALYDQRIENYSGGQKKKVLIARSLSEQAHLYIWDEPLNFIDVLSRIQIERLLTTYKPTIIFVEHDKTFCEDIATKTVFVVAR